MWHTHRFCSLPAPEFRVVDVTKLLLVGVGHSVSQEFNELQPGFKTACQRHVSVLQTTAAVCRLPQMRKFMGWLTITLSFLKFIPMRSFISTLRILCHFCAQYQSADAKPARWHQSLVHFSLCYMMYKSTMSRSLAQTCSWWTLPNGVRRRERLQMFATGRAKTLQTHREKKYLVEINSCIDKSSFVYTWKVLSSPTASWCDEYTRILRHVSVDTPLAVIHNHQ